MTRGFTRCLAVLAVLAATPLAAQRVERISDQATAFDTPLPYLTGGRVTPTAEGPRMGPVTRQWPATYFETAFAGESAGFRIGPGEVHLRITIDDAPPITLLRPAPGLYRIDRLAPGAHSLRIDVLNESIAGPTTFGGFLLGEGAFPLPLRHRRQQIEFIGDSHTLGYGNTSLTRQCTPEEVWLTTDTARGIAPRVAHRFGADYQVIAISGRGVVRNYAGKSGATIPEAYPYGLFDQGEPATGGRWSPQAVVVGLGTNDFSTTLASGEKWPDRDALYRDFEASYVQFVRDLRSRHPHAQIIVWVTDSAYGEVVEAAPLAEALSAGDDRLAFITVSGLALNGCDYHPSLADNAIVADAIAVAIAQSGVFASTHSPAAPVTPPAPASPAATPLTP